MAPGTSVFVKSALSDAVGLKRAAWRCIAGRSEADGFERHSPRNKVEPSGQIQMFARQTEFPVQMVSSVQS